MVHSPIKMTAASTAYIALSFLVVLATDAGAGRGAKGAVLAVLHALGFTPREMPGSPGGGTSEVHLLTCPYLELVRRHPDTMCGLHAGIIRGALRQAGAPDEALVLEPFGAPGAGVVRFSGTGPDTVNP